jgi:hypothetical protein
MLTIKVMKTIHLVKDEMKDPAIVLIETLYIT